MKEWHEQRVGKAKRIFQILNMNYSLNKDSIILDLGCHKGEMGEFFSKKISNTIIGIDISRNSLKYAIKRKNENEIRNVEFVLADATHLPIQKQKIDWVICNHVIDYLDSKQLVLEELSNILKKEGKIYLAVINDLTLKVYKNFEFFLSPILGPYYGRSEPNKNSEFGMPLNYKYWMQQSLKNNDLTITDLTVDIILEKISKKENRFLKKILKVIASKMSPSWVFIIKRKGEKNN